MNDRKSPAPKRGAAPSTDEPKVPKAIWRRWEAQDAPNELCRIASTCKTCRYINTNYKESLDHKYKKQLNLFKDLPSFSHTRLSAPTAAVQTDQYRCHGKFAIRGARETVNPDLYPDNRFKIGLFQPGSRKITDLPRCPLHRPSIERLVKDLRPILEATDLEPYNEEAKTGDIRYLAVRAGHLTAELMVTIVCTHDIRKPLKNVMSQLRMKGHNIAAAYMNLNDAADTSVFSDENTHIAGSQRLREGVCGIEFALSPTAYFQVNPWQAEVLWRRVATLAGEDCPGDTAWDLYSGIGTISLVLAEQGFKVLGIEENPNAVRDAQYNSQKVEAAERAPFYLCGKVEEQMVMLPAWAQAPKVIVCNPSRRGTDETVRQLIIDTLKETDGRRFLYVSCEAETLARDLKTLTDAGLRLIQLEAYDMFPYTEKLEWIAVVTS